MPKLLVKNSIFISFLLISMQVSCRNKDANTPEETANAPMTVQAKQTVRTENNLAFTTLTQGDWGNNDHFYNTFEPALIVITKPKDISSIANWIRQESLTLLQNVDYTNNLAIAVFQGWKGILGYAVQIQRISYRDGVVNVYANFIEHEPGTEELHAEISPYQIVLVQRFEELNEETTFDLMVDDIVIFSYPSDIITLTPTPTQPASPYPSALSTPTSVSPYP
jgi:hypothetical protein